MSKMQELKTITDIVHELLKVNEKARNSDDYLYYLVCTMIGKKNGIDINSMSMPRFFLNLREYGFPAFETVRRTRQKLQADYPELSGDADVSAGRTLNEEIYREYARS